VVVLRWYLNGTRLAQLACDNGIGKSTVYRALHKGIDALAAATPGLPEAMPERGLETRGGQLSRGATCSTFTRR